MYFPTFFLPHGTLKPLKTVRCIAMGGGSGFAFYLEKVPIFMATIQTPGTAETVIPNGWLFSKGMVPPLQCLEVT